MENKGWKRGLLDENLWDENLIRVYGSREDEKGVPAENSLTSKPIWAWGRDMLE
jgi:hypothetical protein